MQLQYLYISDFVCVFIHLRASLQYNMFPSAHLFSKDRKEGTRWMNSLFFHPIESQWEE